MYIPVNSNKTIVKCYNCPTVNHFNDEGFLKYYINFINF